MDLVENIKVLKVFHEATVSDRGGEVLLRCGDDTARVFFVGGKIAWVTVSTNKRTFTDYLIENSSLKTDEAREVFEECKRSGKNFGETIVEWGLLDEESLRGMLLNHLSVCLLEVFSWPSVESMFMPEDRPYKGSLTFDLAELLESVMKLDAEGKLPFSGHATGEIMDELGAGRPAAEVEQQDGETAIPASDERWGKGPTQPYVPSFSGDAGQADQSSEPDIQPDQQTAPRGRRRSLLVVFLLVCVGAAAYYMSDFMFGKKHAGSGGTTTGPAATEPINVPDAGPQAPDGGKPIADATGTVIADAGMARADESVDGGTPDAGSNVADAAGLSADAGSQTADAGKPAKLGSIKVLSRPKGGRVYLDGVYTGKKTPCTLRDVPAGCQHVIMVVKRGRHPAVAHVGLTEDQPSIARMVLRKTHRRLKGRIKVQVESDPAGAVILVNGGRVKKPTPTVIKLKADRDSQLEIRKKKLKWKRSVRPVPGEKITINAKLK